MSRLNSKSSSHLFVLDGISKRFGSLWANREITLDILEGEIHAIVGENGAGKSTLVKILYGHLQPDSGIINFKGASIRLQAPQDAMKIGIGMVFQQPLIFPQLSALENIIVGAEPVRHGGILRKQAESEVQRLCRLFGFNLPLNAQASELPFAHRQQIELLRILYRKAKILILDEPTSLLAPAETEQLLGLLRSLREKGCTVLFISHRLREVFAIADRISILRRGECIGTLPASDTSMEELAGLIVSQPETATVLGIAAKGRTPSEDEPSDGAQKIVLDMRNVTAKPSGGESGLNDFSLEIHTGEIIGIGGIVGNGQRSLARVLAGMDAVESGSIILDGREITRCAISERIQRGLRWLPANPLEEMLLPARSIWENFLLGHQREVPFQVGSFLCKEKIKRRTERELALSDLTYSGADQIASGLSGGNAQKLALARSLSGDLSLAVLEQPGRGLDMGAQEKLHRQIRALSAKGVAFLIISYDLDELLALCSRIGALFRGCLAGIVDRRDATPEMLGRWMLGLNK